MHVQPTSQSRHGPTPGIPAPVEADPPAALRLIVNPAAVIASRERHPCAVTAPAATAPCRQCGFVIPESSEISSLLRALPGVWATLLQAGEADAIEDGACLRDEIHAVTNRIDQLLVSPDAIFAPVRTNPRNALARLVNPRLLVALLEVATTRLAALTDTVHAEQWQRRGRVRAGTVSIAELATLPLHRTQRRQTFSHPVPALRLVPIDVLSKTNVT